MLKVIQHDSVKSEHLKSDYYVVSMNWNHTFPGRHIFWRTGNFKHSLLEIGFNEETHTLESLAIVIVQQDWFSTQDIVDFNPLLPIKTGLPPI